MNKKNIKKVFNGYTEEQKIKFAMEAAKRGVSIENDIIPIIESIACISEEAANLFLENYRYIAG